jgi:SAM-dependent methyltransferase
MGTGGGELLASMNPLPHDTWATEGYPPNLPIARARLGPLGIKVLPVDGDVLPFADGSFDLVINRHESFDAREVHRVLRPNGTFITQQVGAKDLIELNETLQEKVSLAFPEWEVSGVSEQIKTAGMDVVVAQDAFPEAEFADVGAVVFFLKVAPWQIQDFTSDRYRDRLRLLHQRMLTQGKFRVHTHRFFIIARKL